MRVPPPLNTQLTKSNGFQRSALKYEGWTAYWSPQTLRVCAQPVWASPALVDAMPLSNTAEIRGRIAVVERGRIPIVYKVLGVQEAGAIGVVVVDDGRCVADRLTD